MSDRELLELAAKAAGYVIFIDEYDDGSFDMYINDAEYWNPLTDGYDAFRLSVQLRLNVFHWDKSVSAIDEQGGSPEQSVAHGEDVYAATCRAIVKAAAEIGRSMP